MIYPSPCKQNQNILQVEIVQKKNLNCLHQNFLGAMEYNNIQYFHKASIKSNFM